MLGYNLMTRFSVYHCRSLHQPFFGRREADKICAVLCDVTLPS